MEKDGKFFENVFKQLSFSNVNFSIPGEFLNGPLQIE
jgi:hypothetical protein